MRQLICDRCGAVIAPLDEYKKLRLQTVRANAGARSILDPGETITHEIAMDLCALCAKEVRGVILAPTSAEVDVPGVSDTTMQIAACCVDCGSRKIVEEQNRYVCTETDGDCPEKGATCPWWGQEKE